MSVEQHLNLNDLEISALQRLCGVLDENLNSLSRALEIQIVRRHHRFSISGRLAKEGVSALQQLAEIAKKREIDSSDIQLVAVSVKTRAEEKSDINISSSKGLHTRRGILHGRTPRQDSYIRALLTHDIVFGLGPAGTGKTYLAVAAAVDRALPEGLGEGEVVALAGLDLGQLLEDVLRQGGHHRVWGDKTRALCPHCLPLAHTQATSFCLTSHLDLGPGAAAGAWEAACV